MADQSKFNNAMKFFIWLQGCIGIFFMYKCLTYPEVNIFLCLIAGVTICALVLISALTLTDSLNQFYFDIAHLNESVRELNKTMKRVEFKSNGG